MRKEENILELFMDEPTRHWQFEEILKAAKISRPQASNWLKKLVQEKIILRIKPKGKMPYYIGNYEHPNYQNKKKLFALSQLDKTGFLNHLAGLQKTKTIIIFGSFSRWDWYKDSDIDLFIYGTPEGFDSLQFRKLLHRDIQTFICKDKKEIKELSPALLKNILEGHLIKGTLDFIKVSVDV